ncbi:DUF4405 domain-containing protein [Pontiella sulfatireligans]|uniref:Flavinylation-associated cytochrome domain-containing protein n=1 Tax=Pontiella sulfatireligans TaxID=2750658 RepID=A0A6C2UI91_9BACT|nr:DUF4405 domain-containing protein [Pontiella sulfatireligans]VGO19932.1 hypothetical protein SCARR_01992 [Pontiella sulfatireligans]
MKKTAARIVTDILMFILMCFLAGTGLLIHYRLVPGNRGGHGLEMLGLTRHEWGAYHLWAAYLLLFCVLVHLVLNYAFIRNVIAAGKPWIMAVLGLMGLLITLLFLLMPVERTDDDTKGRGRRFQERHPGSVERIDARKPAP